MIWVPKGADLGTKQSQFGIWDPEGADLGSKWSQLGIQMEPVDLLGGEDEALKPANPSEVPSKGG